ncbi:hypothetical protein AB4Y45_35290 [Paraburkholderia sp. EG287A]|uniref:hypothetical protein n=1 Tax=Paraburkholderia sp. EG287A TaxID=3237012 RepID=UPI0034D210BD
MNEKENVIPREPGSANDGWLTSNWSMALVSAVAFFALASALWVLHAVPVSAQDLKDASWLYGITDVVHFSSLFVGLGLTMACMGIFVGSLKRRYIFVVESVLIGALISVAGLPTLNFIAAAEGGSAKVGCFVQDTKECHAMLGLAGAVALPSMYVPREQADRTGEVYTPAYDKKTEELRSRADLFMPALSAVGRAPFIAFHTDALNAKLKVQRAEVASLRAADDAAPKH